MSERELKPCPFCGNENVAIANECHDLSGGYFIACPACGGSTGLRYACGDDPRPLLIEQWNRRTARSGQAASGSSQGARSDVQNGVGVGQPEVPTAAPLQPHVHPWLIACFGQEIAADREERNHRFLEESIELVQACGCSADEAHQLVDYVYGRPVGEKDQEVGGVMITLAALCLANGLDMHEAGERELARIWTMVEKIRAKQAAKPKHSPLPIAHPPARSGAGSEENKDVR